MMINFLYKPLEIYFTKQAFLSINQSSNLPILVKVKNILAKRPTHACMESRVSFAKANMVNGR